MQCFFPSLLILFASPTCTLASFYACEWEMLCNKRVSAEPFHKGPQWVDNKPRGEHGLLWRLKWGDPTPSLSIALAFDSLRSTFFLRPFCRGSRSHSLDLCLMLSFVFFVLVLSGFSLFAFMTKPFDILFSYLILSALFLRLFSIRILPFCSLVCYYVVSFCPTLISSSLESMPTFPPRCLSLFLPLISSHPISLHLSPSSCGRGW